MPIIRKMFHTQGFKLPYLNRPIICKRRNAWLGTGYYFWYEDNDAIIWGKEAKRDFGSFVVYVADIDCENILDTVFVEKHYLFWCKVIDKVADDILKKTGRKASIKEVNDILKKNNVWKDVTGIMYQDIPNNPDRNKVMTLLYRKRIQLVAFDLNIVSNFVVHYEAAC
jgi:hypothetical protein